MFVAIKQYYANLCLKGIDSQTAANWCIDSNRSDNDDQPVNANTDHTDLPYGPDMACTGNTLCALNEVKTFVLSLAGESVLQGMSAFVKCDGQQ